MSNKSEGNKFEQVVAKRLSEYGFWAHRIAPSAIGQQPADIIAVKNGKAFLIDAKLCLTASGFKFSRIEDNQEFSMTLWREKGNGEGWFAIGIEDEIYMFPLGFLTIARQYHSGLSPYDIEHDGIRLDKWVKKYAKD